MIQILTKTPLYVWALLLLLIWGGVKSLGLKTNRVYSFHLHKVVIMPIAMFVWSGYSMFSSYSGIIHFIWLIGTFSGLFLGYQTVKKAPLFFDKGKNIIQTNASFLPLILSLLIFSLRYYVNASKALNENANNLLSVQACEILACLVSGILLGRVVGYFIRKSAAMRSSLTN